VVICLSRLVLPFWYRLTWVIPEKWLLNRCMYVHGNVTGTFDWTVKTQFISELPCMQINQTHYLQFNKITNSHIKFFNLPYTNLISSYTMAHLPSVLWHCWLGGRKGIRPVLAWLSVWFAVHTYIRPRCCHCHSLSLASVKSWLVFTFLVPAHPGSPGQRAVKCVCVCVLHYGTLLWDSAYQNL